ncbi:MULTISPECIES: hypothetical protein [unclassified Bradyrhizobium]|uniref:hypothetical protein n=1 Tax=unclassified Bradyrhizobium TaxID=2631580 RepID=UPI00291605F8|nr:MULTISPECIES: hypothetical protein [unclassified Bradyrhizobium]
MSLLLALFRARDHRGLDGDEQAEDDRRRTRLRAEAQRRTPAERVSCLARNGPNRGPAGLVPWGVKPRGRKSLSRRCAQTIEAQPVFGQIKPSRDEVRRRIEQSFDGEASLASAIREADKILAD